MARAFRSAFDVTPANRSDELGAEAALKNVTGALVPPIEPLRVYPIELAHRGREVRLGRLEEQVIVVAHQTVRMAANMVADHGGSQHNEEAGAVVLVEEDRLTIVPARGHMVDPTGEMKSERPRHAPTLPLRASLTQVCHLRNTCRQEMSYFKT